MAPGAPAMSRHPEPAAPAALEPPEALPLSGLESRAFFRKLELWGGVEGLVRWGEFEWAALRM